MLCGSVMVKMGVATLLGAREDVSTKSFTSSVNSLSPSLPPSLPPSLSPSLPLSLPSLPSSLSLCYCRSTSYQSSSLSSQPTMTSTQDSTHVLQSSTLSLSRETLQLTRSLIMLKLLVTNVATICDSFLRILVCRGQGTRLSRNPFSREMLHFRQFVKVFTCKGFHPYSSLSLQVYSGYHLDTAVTNVRCCHGDDCSEGYEAPIRLPWRHLRQCYRGFGRSGLPSHADCCLCRHGNPDNAAEIVSISATGGVVWLPPGPPQDHSHFRKPLPP